MLLFSQKYLKKKKAQKHGAKLERENKRMDTGGKKLFLLFNRCVCFKEKIG